MAARYPDVTIGTNVLCNSYRYPPTPAKMAATLQELSRGRLVLGYGAGWDEREYRAWGFEFPSTRTRIAQMVEAIRLMRAMWSGEPTRFEGEFYRVDGARCVPAPDPPPPILIGGDGERYLLRAVAEQADLWLPFSRGAEALKQKMDVLRAHCADAGRDYDAIRKTYKLTVHLARDRAAAQRSLAAAAARENPPFAGTPAELRDHLAAMVEIGIDLFQLQFPNFPRTDDMELFADEVMPAFR
jgi:alkanesulfonate monooxygenase SsuD/methylene tetrahydromethanopterin reductase-like flavin-dependent oxidoreductase (luciferase family)